MRDAIGPSLASSASFTATSSATARSALASRVETSSVVAPRLAPRVEPLADPLLRPDERHLVDERVRHRGRGVALLAVEEELLDLARLLLVAVAREQRRCRSSARARPCRRCRARSSASARRVPPATSSMSTTGTLGAMSNPSRAPFDREDLARALGREEERHPAVRDLERELDRLRPHRRRGRSGSRCGAAAPSASAACRARSRRGPSTGCRSARRGARARRGAGRRARSRRTRASSRAACPTARRASPSTTCGPDVPSPSRKRPPESRSSVAAVIAVFAGVRPGICMIAEPTLIRSVVAASQASTRDGVRPPRLRGPRRVVAERAPPPARARSARAGSSPGGA